MLPRLLFSSTHPSRLEIYRNNMLEPFRPLTFMDWALGKYGGRGWALKGLPWVRAIHYRWAQRG
jgi:hypothetical protein